MTRYDELLTKVYAVEAVLEEMRRQVARTSLALRHDSENGHLHFAHKAQDEALLQAMALLKNGVEKSARHRQQAIGHVDLLTAF